MQTLPGFRDFLPPDCATRNYIFAKWREVARRYGFIEWDGPVLEPTELYKKKSGDEIVSQLFHFVDKGHRDVALRPELTPTLARVVAAHNRDYRKPLKWFSIGQCFRYEKQQRGRLREHYQLNCDIIGEPSIAAEAELIALAIDVLRSFGLTQQHFVVRLSSREVWLSFLGNKLQAFNDAELRRFFEAVDKIDRQSQTKTAELLRPFSTSVEDLHDWVRRSREFLLDPNTDRSQFANTTLERIHELLHDHLAPRRLGEFLDVDFTIVRGLAYYTSTVFEIFDRQKKLRAIAGGGRFDNLISQLSNGRISMPAIGFAMGDVVLDELIQNVSDSRVQLHNEIQKYLWVQIYIVVANEERRAVALALVQWLRENGYKVDYALNPARVSKQFESAYDVGAKVAILCGDEWPLVVVRNLVSGEQRLISHQELLQNPLLVGGAPGWTSYSPIE